MKKFYTLFVASAVAMSAIAGSVDADFFKPHLGDVLKSQIRANRNAYKPVTPAAVSSFDDLVGVYDMAAYSYYYEEYVSSTHEITAVTGKENTVKFSGILYGGMEFEGVVDLAAGTITVAPGQVIFSASGADYCLSMCHVNSTNDGFDLDSSLPIVFNISSDGEISQAEDSPICISRSDGTYIYDVFEEVSYVPSDKNVRFEFNEYVMDDYGQLTGEIYPAEVWAKASSSGDKVVVEDLLLPDYSPDPFVIDVDFSAGTATIKGQRSFNYGGYDIYVYGVENGNDFVDINGTVDGNVISWTGDWGYFMDLGNNEYRMMLYFKDGKFTFIFDLASSGVSDFSVGDENAPAEYFNLQGVRVDNPSNGLYIRRQGNVSTKVLVK